MMWQGKCSSFGGPDDKGVGENEGLALIEPIDLSVWWFGRLFGENKGTGLARQLNPNSFYLAMRFAYGKNPGTGKQGEILPGWSRAAIRAALFRVSSVNGGGSCYVQAADWGPDERTNRLVDLSPGILKMLKLKTDDEVMVDLV